MRKLNWIISSICVAVLESTAQAQLLYDGFNYTAGQNLTTGTPSFSGQLNPNGTRWSSAGNLADSIAVSSPGLSVSGLAAPSGNALSWAAGGSASRAGIGPFEVSTAGTTVWYSYALQITDPSILPVATGIGNLIAGFNTLGPPQTGVPTVVGTRVFARQHLDANSQVDGFQLGMSRNSSTAGDPTYELDASSQPVGHAANTTLLLVGSYTLKSDNSDVSQLWINPDPSTFGSATPPAPTITSTAGAVLSTRRIESFVFRQSGSGTAATGITADELRLDTTWAGVTQPLGTAWSADTDGNWSSGGNWSAGVPTIVANLPDIATVPRTVSVDSPQTASIINLSSSGSGAWIIGGASALTLSGAPELNNYAGNNTISAPLSVSGDLNVNTNAASKLTTGNVSYSSTGTVRKTGTGVWEVNNVRAGTLAIHSVVIGGAGTGGTMSGGTLRVIPNGTSSGVTVVKNLLFPQFIPPPSGGFIPTASTLDLTNNGLVIDYNTTSPMGTGTITSQANPGVYNLLLLAYAGGAWTGPGLTSSTSAADASTAHKTGLGFGENSVLNYTTFIGQTVDNTALLVRYTYCGDANLDGTVDTVDFNILASNFSLTGKLWSDADFNFDGAVDTVDFNLLASNFSLSLPGSSLSQAALVPEPSCALALLGAFIFFTANRSFASAVAGPSIHPIRRRELCKRRPGSC